MNAVEALLTEALPNPAAPSYIVGMSKSYQVGDILFDEGAVGREMFIVLGGEVRIDRACGDTRMHLGTFRPGDFFGEMALVESGARTGRATVHEDQTRLVAVNQARFVYLVSQQPAFALSIMRAMGKRVEEMNLRLAEMGVAAVEGATL
ncbi:MAG: hypothetical protein RJA34_975 [Pseudomonadota bacterium]|jgi:CRP-like cAMP-binding protein